MKIENLDWIQSNKKA